MLRSDSHIVSDIVKDVQIESSFKNDIKLESIISLISFVLDILALSLHSVLSLTSKVFSGSQFLLVIELLLVAFVSCI